MYGIYFQQKSYCFHSDIVSHLVHAAFSMYLILKLLSHIPDKVVDLVIDDASLDTLV